MSFVAKLRKWSNYSALHQFDVKTIKNVQWCQKHSKERKTTKLIKLQWIASIWCQNDKKKLKTTNAIKLRSICIDLTSKQSKTLRYGRKTFKTTQNYQTDQITIDCIDLSSKQSKMLRYVAKLRKWSNYSALHRFDV